MKNLLSFLFLGILIGLPLSLNAEDNTNELVAGCDCGTFIACQETLCKKDNVGKNCTELPIEKRVNALNVCYTQMKQCPNRRMTLQNCSEDSRLYLN